MVSSVHYLCITFPTAYGIATVKGDQIGSMECYLNSLRKTEPHSVNMVTDAEMIDALVEGPHLEQKRKI